MSKKKSFIINRAKWLHGEVNERSAENNSVLLRPEDGKMCCLGFFAKSVCQLKNKDIESIGDLELEILKNSNLKNKFPKWFFEKYGLSADAWSLMEANDIFSLEDLVRENIIQTLFKKHNIDVKFVGKY